MNYGQKNVCVRCAPVQTRNRKEWHRRWTKKSVHRFKQETQKSAQAMDKEEVCTGSIKKHKRRAQAVDKKKVCTGSNKKHKRRAQAMDKK